MQIPDATQLTGVGAGHRVVVERISDSDPALLQFFEEHGFVIGSMLEIGEGAPFSDALDARVTGSDTSVALGRSATDALYVSVVAS